MEGRRWSGGIEPGFRHGRVLKLHLVQNDKKIWGVESRLLCRIGVVAEWEECCGGGFGSGLVRSELEVHSREDLPRSRIWSPQSLQLSSPTNPPTQVSSPLQVKRL
ncbi:unnamed protein product [Linum trigynum]|uniref:Uncharacterized protein n=1 Tax=Linum trigynum TaxID=586398 RepID=A0AAV2G5S3_9ROSI